MFCTGIENSYPTIQLPDNSIKRIDEMEKAHHYKIWEEDFNLVKEMGIDFLRYGPPYYSTHVAPGKYNWDGVEMIVAYKVDLLTTDEICLDIFYGNLQITFTEETPGWYLFIKKLGSVFPSIPSCWDAVIAQPAFAENRTVLYRRGQ